MATYSGWPVVARVFIGQRQWQCSFCEAVLLRWCFLGRAYLYLGVLRMRTGEVCCKHTRHSVNTNGVFWGQEPRTKKRSCITGRGGGSVGGTSCISTTTRNRWVPVDPNLWLFSLKSWINGSPVETTSQSPQCHSVCLNQNLPAGRSRSIRKCLFSRNLPG